LQGFLRQSLASGQFNFDNRIVLCLLRGGFVIGRPGSSRREAMRRFHGGFLFQTKPPGLPSPFSGQHQDPNIELATGPVTP
jgi:hypothetical protein